MPDLDLSSMQPGDAAATLRSFPRRFREAARTTSADLDGEPDEGRVEEMAARVGPDGWSATDVMAAAAARLRDAHDVLGQVLVRDDAVVPVHLTTTPTGIPGSGGPSGFEEELDRLSTVAGRMADLVDGADAERWNAVVPVEGGGTMTPLRMVQTALAPVVLWLREVDRTLRAVRGRPGA